LIDAAINALKAAKGIQVEIDTELGPPEEGKRSAKQKVIPLSLVRDTRGYILRIANQANGAYEMGWYDACAVMVRRLIETLIIEAFEKGSISDKIKNDQGEFFYLKDLVARCISEPSWNLGRGCKQALPRLKDIGDKSAHSRRFNAQRGDLDPLLTDIRDVVQELIYLAGLM
jgi:hypothetical protein